MIATFFLVALVPAVFGAAIDNCQMMCYAVYDPVCGSDGHTYSNDCHLHVANCKDNSINLLHKGSCLQTAATQCPLAICPMNYDPICGTDGKTYGNMCDLKSTHCTGDVQVAHHGPCDMAVSK